MVKVSNPLMTMEVSEWERTHGCDYGPQLIAFADNLVENFFLRRETF